MHRQPAPINPAVQPVLQGQQAFAGQPVPQAIRPLQLINILLRGRWIIVGITLVVALATSAYVMTIPPTFSATAKFMPSQGVSASARMGAIAGSTAAVADPANETTAPEYYTTLLTSRGFLERLLLTQFEVPSMGGSVPMIDTLDIQASSDAERLERGIQALQKDVKVSSVRMKSTSAPPIITVTVSARDPQLSAAAANALVDELVRFNRDSRGSKATDTRAFVEVKLDEARAMLQAAEKSLADFRRYNRRLATPDLRVEEERLARAVTVQEEVFITLTKQLELARIQEQEDQVSIQLIEPAVAPLQRSAPQRTRTVLMAAVAAMMGSCGLVLVLSKLRGGQRDDPDIRDFNANLRSIARDLTFGVAGR
jgi:uncharacterized protein involved in exopolysaccharide biosynthesis